MVRNVLIAVLEWLAIWNCRALAPLSTQQVVVGGAGFSLCVSIIRLAPSEFTVYRSEPLASHLSQRVDRLRG